MMNTEAFKAKSLVEIEGLVAKLSMGNFLKVSFGEIFSDEADHDDHISGSVNVDFQYKNCRRTHVINLGCDNAYGFGLENNDGEVYELTHINLLSSMYFDLALSDLADEHLE